MGPNKAPGPNGLPPCLFQHFWHILGDKVFETMQSIFQNEKLLPGFNETIICLLPKGVALESLNQFRPISLCNMLLKVVSKILENRLKPLMCQFTSYHQSSFVLGRSTTVNIVVAQEALHTLSRQKGRKGDFILKVDLEKSYDCIDWKFLQEVLTFLSFRPELRDLIFDCISLAKLAVC